MISRLEGYSGDGFNERWAYINSQNSKNYLNDKKKLEEKIKKEQQNKQDNQSNRIEQKKDYLNKINSLMNRNGINH